jgi:UDP-N-acetylmuramate dehydrogenase
MEIKRNISLSEFTTIKIGGPADYFFIAENKNDLMEAVSYAKNNNLPFFILGGGSNVLFSDYGFRGVVIKIQNPKLQITNKLQFLKSKIQNNEIYAEAGVELKKIVEFAMENSLTGLEWAAGIPGSVGGAIYGNAGAFGSAMGDSIKEIEAVNVNSGKIIKFSKEDCLFSNKETIFKKRKELVIISAVFNFKNGDKNEIKEKIKENINYRAKNHPLDFPSAGCAFKNAESKVVSQELWKEFPELKQFNEKGIIPASYLIDRCGLKGKKIGNAQISEKHANFIVNLGNAKATDVLGLIEIAKKQVKNKFEVELEEEIQIIK